MIVTVTLNPALDVTYDVDALVVDATNRVAGMSAHAGGKGVNVARLLRLLGAAGATSSGSSGSGGFGRLGEAARGVEIVALGFAGGATGGELLADLDRAGVGHAFVACAGETRRTVAVVDGGAGTVTMLNEPGPVVTPGEWETLRDRLEGLLPEASAVVLSGSLPPGLPPDAYATLVRLATGHGVPAVLDTSGTALRLALPAGPEIVKPNAAELAGALSASAADPAPPWFVTSPASSSASGPAAGFAAGSAAGSATGHAAATGRPPGADPGDSDGPRDPAVPSGLAGLAGGAAWMRGEGARAVVVSDGPRGLYADTPDGRWRAVPPEVVGGNPTGAGDAAVAALALGLVSGWDWPCALVEAAALSAAAVGHPVAGRIDPEPYLGHVDRVRLDRVRSDRARSDRARPEDAHEESEGTSCR
ncbi:1-phosphofructokinase family hexose kinase [Streptosporangium sp. V21-05]|uniref:1-phosphofructokinase family hexose kinase n=1 Tax=Streptosporangium sp. V21-05 TaxID=3446115 RepID=UPI003F532C6F